MRDTLRMPPGVSPVGLDLKDRRLLAGWLFLAVGALALAGVFALLLAAARMPFVGESFKAQFYRALVEHVDLAYVVSFLAMLGGLSVAARPGGLISKLGLALAAAGTLLMITPILTGRGEPQIINYIPMFDDGVFHAGLCLIALGVALPVMYLLVRPPSWGGALAMGLGAAGLVYLLALLCFALAWNTGHGFGVDDEALVWGGGHLLQIVNTAMALTAWQVLAERAFGRPLLSFRAWQIACGLIVLAGVPGPVFYTAASLLGSHAHDAYTWVYRILLPWPVLLVGGAAVRTIVRQPPQWRSPAYLGLVLSLATVTVGAVFGYFADGQDTRTPAHYHAELIGVILALMGLFFAVLMPLLAKDRPVSRPVLLQFWLLGGGQIVAACGMFVAGWAGVGRKVAGAAQGLDSIWKQVGMGLNGLGGLVAVVGGVMFICLALSRLLVRSADE